MNEEGASWAISIDSQWDSCAQTVPRPVIDLSGKGLELHLHAAPKIRALARALTHQSLGFSLESRCHGPCGSEKSAVQPMRRMVLCASPSPAPGRASCSGLNSGCLIMSMSSRLVRSTNVPTALTLAAPLTGYSPSGVGMPRRFRPKGSSALLIRLTLI